MLCSMSCLADIFSGETMEPWVTWAKKIFQSVCVQVLQAMPSTSARNVWSTHRPKMFNE